MKNDRDEVQAVLQGRLDALRKVIETKQAELRPLQEEERKLERMLKEYGAGSMGSGEITDDDIVSYIRRNAQENSPLRTPEVASGLGVDARGISKRLPRMARDGILSGNAQSGYYVAVKSRVRQHA